MAVYGPWLITSRDGEHEQVSEVFVADKESHDEMSRQVDVLVRDYRLMVMMEPIEHDETRVYISPGDIKDVFGWLADRKSERQARALQARALQGIADILRNPVRDPRAWQPGDPGI